MRKPFAPGRLARKPLSAAVIGGLIATGAPVLAQADGAVNPAAESRPRRDCPGSPICGIPGARASAFPRGWRARSGIASRRATSAAWCRRRG